MPAFLVYAIEATAYLYGMKPVRGDSKNCAFVCHLIYSEGERRVAGGGWATGTLRVIGSNKSATKAVTLFELSKWG